MKINSTNTKTKDIVRHWQLFDVKGKILGRVSTEIAGYLIGKAKPYFVNHLDCGDYVVVVNAKEIVVTGNKANQKIYEHFSGYPGGLNKKTFARVLQEDPTRIVREAVTGMLPNNKLRDSMLRRLLIYPDANHPYKSKFTKEN